MMSVHKVVIRLAAGLVPALFVAALAPVPWWIAEWLWNHQENVVHVVVAGVGTAYLSLMGLAIVYGFELQDHID